jgi:hypothetical protein
MSDTSEEISEISEKIEVGEPDASEKVHPIGRVYKMTGGGLAYIGSTKNTLAQRLREHRSDFKRHQNGTKAYISSFKLFQGDGGVIIELLEEHTDITKAELHKRERYFIENSECVNAAIPYRSKAEHAEIAKLNKKAHHEENKEYLAKKNKEYHKLHRAHIAEKAKEYQQLNRVHIAEKAKEYQQLHRAHIAEKAKEYQQLHRAHIAEKAKEYRQLNKAKLAEREKIKIKCEICKCDVRKSDFRRHEKSVKHITNNNTYNIYNITHSTVNIAKE